MREMSLLKSMRIPVSSFMLVEEIQEQTGYNFTQAIVYIINEYSRFAQQNEMQNQIRELQQLSEELKGLLETASTNNPETSHDTGGIDEILQSNKIMTKTLIAVLESNVKTAGIAQKLKKMEG